MPTYEYVCTACGHPVEVIHGLHGHGPTVCAECGGTMRKAFAPPHVVFKGTGWARKDRSSSSSQPRKTQSHGTAEGGSSASSDTSQGDSTGTTE